MTAQNQPTTRYLLYPLFVTLIERDYDILQTMNYEFDIAPRDVTSVRELSIETRIRLLAGAVLSTVNSHFTAIERRDNSFGWHLLCSAIRQVTRNNPEGARLAKLGTLEQLINDLLC